jgi:hypothetical protein
VIGIVGRDGGYTAQAADVCIIVPTVNVENIAACGSLQAVIAPARFAPATEEECHQMGIDGEMTHAAVFLDRDGVKPSSHS